jgi:23S rRNA (cytidine1920-2'-O)/16S rRNA (cytidine1409-2'-O)-methyltransferase
MRLDLRVAQQFNKSRSASADFIKRGLVLVNGKINIKPANEVIEDDDITLTLEKTYVSRGGEKLASLLPFCPFSVAGLHAIDVGSSTGGFSECLLDYGVESLVCVDVGVHQLHESLRDHPKITLYEGVSILDLHQVIHKTFDLLVMDVSFTSILHVFDALDRFVHHQTWLILLYKPQFEVGAKFLNKSGIVKNPRQGKQVQDHIIEVIKTKGFRFVLAKDSTIKGKDGNQETFLVFQKVEGV